MMIPDVSDVSPQLKPILQHMHQALHDYCDASTGTGSEQDTHVDTDHDKPVKHCPNPLMNLSTWQSKQKYLHCPNTQPIIFS